MANDTRKTLLRTTAAATICGLMLLSTPAVWAQSRTYQFDIPAENAAKALNDFSRQSGVQILFPYDAAAKVNAPAIKGTMTRQDALNALLAATNLEVASETDQTISLRVKESPRPTDSATQTDAVIVTGTHIRGVNPTSPVHTVTRKDIEQSGYTQIGDVVRSLPENFGGGQNPGVIGASHKNNNNSNVTNASTINLRGLGADATLTLLNGHRLPGDGLQQGSDISGIPLAAVQRIDVVTDGSSALYGSEAVAGVANIVLRKTYTGAELSGSYGASTQGGGATRLISGLAGNAGYDGYWLFSAEGQKNDPILASQRDATSEVAPSTSLIQGGDRQSAFFAAGRTLTDRLSVDFDSLVSNQSSLNTLVYAGDDYITNVFTREYSAALSADYRIGDRWRLHATGVMSGDANRYAQAIPAYDYVGTSRFKNAVQYGEVTSDGPVFHLPAGDVKAAVGIGYRHDLLINDSDIHGSRDDRYYYGELSVPLVSEPMNVAGIRSLDLSLSARSEDYSDFGKSTNPRIGLRYRPIADLAIRATWGKSFKAPSFYQQDFLPNLYAFDATTSGYSGSNPEAIVLVADGGNAKLKPERSTSWTLGADFTPSSIPTLALSATAFNIDYRDRVVQPINPTTEGISNPIFAPFVTSNPTPAQIAAIEALTYTFTNYSGFTYDDAKVVSILDDRFTNASAQTVSGLDLSYRQSFDAGTDGFDLFANATWLRLDQQTIETMPNLRLSGTIANPAKFRARGGLTWRHGALTSTLSANYVADEIDNGDTTEVPVGSWTTADLTLSYVIGAGSGKPLKIGLAVSNLFDTTPPYTVSTALAWPGIHYDSTNTSIVGRFVTLSLTKDW